MADCKCNCEIWRFTSHQQSYVTDEAHLIEYLWELFEKGDQEV